MALIRRMDSSYFIFVIAGALAGGFVTGVAGFGTGLTALTFWLVVLPPQTAATLVVVISVASQAQSLPAIRRSLEPERLAPFAVPGLIGVPIGAALLSHVEVQSFKLAIGVLLVIYATHSLVFRSPAPVIRGGRIADGISGLCGGLLGGLAGLSGPVPTMWINMRGWPKDQKRSVIQGFNLTILAAAFIAHLACGFVTRELLLAAAVALPAAASGTWLGVRAYKRMSDRQFTKLILVLLGMSGFLLMWTNFI